MTVAQMRRNMGYDELIEWHAWDELRVADQERADRMARKGMKAR
jgi:hypothetical protein